MLILITILTILTLKPLAVVDVDIEILNDGTKTMFNLFTTIV